MATYGSGLYGEGVYGGAIPEGTAAGAIAWTGSSVGDTPPNAGSATGSFDFAATATGATGYRGAASGALDFTGSTTGSKPSRGSSVGALDFTGTSAGSVAHDGTAAGTYDETGSSVGAMPTWQPHNLVATPASGSQIDLTWDALDYSTGYDIERDGVIVATDVATNSYSDTGLDPETLYTYRVRAVQ